MKMGGFSALVLFGLLALFTGCTGETRGGAGPAEGQIDVFEKNILPLLQQNCAGANCHSSGASGATALTVSSSSSQTYLGVKALVTPGNAAASSLTKSMGALYGSSAMWQIISDWINDGAKQYGPASTPPVEIPPPAEVPMIGLDNCSMCHPNQCFAFITSKHANTQETGGHCYHCHDPSYASQYMPQAFHINSVGTVGCEDCHGSGIAHNGTGPITLPKPPQSTCTADCHPLTNVSAYSSDGSFYHSTRWTAMDSQNRPAIKFSSGKPVYDSKGALTYYTVADANHTVAGYAFGSFTNLKFDTTGQGEVIDHEFDPRAGRFIYDTHYTATTDTLSQTSSPARIAGYVLDANSPLECIKCHNPHSANLDLNREWAESRHGGRIWKLKTRADELGVKVSSLADPSKTPDKQTVKTPAPHTAAGSEYPVSDLMKAVSPEDAGVGGSVWVHYNWDDTNSRGSCQKCKTATAIKNYLDVRTSSGSWDPSLYDYKANDFSYLKNWSSSGGSPQNEMLYCWGCHSDAYGNLRNPESTKPDYTRYSATVDASVSPTSGITTAYVSAGNLRGSNVCAACHAGRGDGNVTKTIFGVTKSVQVVNSGASAPSVSYGPGAYTATQTHYTNAAATIFQASLHPGYEYPGRDYTNPDLYYNYSHMNAGMGEDDERGPCVACHMGDTLSHRFSILDENGGIITQSYCDSCHIPNGPYAITGHMLEEEKAAFRQALDALTAALKKRGAYYDNKSHPYFFLCNVSDTGPWTKTSTRFYYWTDWTKWADPAAPELTAYTRSAKNPGTPATPAGKDLYVFTYADTATQVTDPGFAGAAHNLSYLDHEPGAFAHNSFYAKRLIFDSLDYLDNHTLDGVINLSAYPEAADWYQRDHNASNDNQVARP